jgi:hypothetical protein
MNLKKSASTTLFSDTGEGKKRGNKPSSFGPFTWGPGTGLSEGKQHGRSLGF